MTERAEGDEFRGQWFTFPVSYFLHDRDPAGPPVTIELRTASSPAVVEVSGGEARTRLGTAAAQRPPQIVEVSWGRREVEGLGAGKDFKLYPGCGRAWDWAETGTRHSPGIQPADVEELVAL